MVQHVVSGDRKLLAGTKKDVDVTLGVKTFVKNIGVTVSVVRYRMGNGVRKSIARTTNAPIMIATNQY